MRTCCHPHPLPPGCHPAAAVTGAPHSAAVSLLCLKGPCSTIVSPPWQRGPHSTAMAEGTPLCC